MSPDGLLAIIGILLAAWAIMPEERRIDLRLRLGFADWLCISVGVVAVHYFSFYSLFRKLSLTPHLGLSRWGVTPDLAAYLTVLGLFVFIWIRGRKSKMTGARIKSFGELVSRLVMHSRFTEAIFFLEQHHRELFRIYNRDFFTMRLRDRIMPQSNSVWRYLSQLGRDDKSVSQTHLCPTVIDKITTAVAHLFPSGEQNARVAEDIVKRLFLSVDVVNWLARTNPYFATQILDHDFREKYEFVELFVRGLLEYSSSVLYAELRENQTIYRDRYIIDDRNRLIHFFLSDARKAENLAVYKPFGDYTLEHLDALFCDSSKDRYNQPLGYYDESEKWRCPIYATVHFIDLMVSEALYQGIEWHMWLYYMLYIVERIVRNLSPQDTVELSREWPTPYHFLLYDIVSTMGKWIEMVRMIPPDQANIVLQNHEIDHENGNIPKSTILALAESFRTILKAGRVTNGFKVYILEHLLHVIKQLRSSRVTEPYAALLQKAIIRGGFAHGQDQKQHASAVAELFAKVDFVTRLDYKLFSEELGGFLKENNAES